MQGVPPRLVRHQPLGDMLVSTPASDLERTPSPRNRITQMTRTSRTIDSCHHGHGWNQLLLTDLPGSYPFPFSEARDSRMNLREARVEGPILWAYGARPLSTRSRYAELARLRACSWRQRSPCFSS